MYHYVRVNPVASDKLGYGLSTTPADFAAQMALLAERGYRTLSVSELLAESAKPNHGKIVALTFDDGYADAYTEALPVLRRHGMRGTFYVITSFIGRGGYLSVDQTREMAAAGMIIGSHTVGHPDLTRLDRLGLRRELGDSRAELEKLVGKPVVDFCYPSGRFDPAARAAVEQAGYQTATTTQYGYAGPGQDPLLLPRVRISGGMTLGEFAGAIGER
jgi:peptidoglycan/xylan/chitin deacetylase (PgdA/CDA1 family)